MTLEQIEKLMEEYSKYLGKKVALRQLDGNAVVYCGWFDDINSNGVYFEGDVMFDWEELKLLWVDEDVQQN